MVARHSWSNGPYEGEKAYIAIPCGSEMNSLTAFSLAKLTAHLEEEGESFELSLELGNCHVDDARNNLVDRFLQSDADYLVFIDSDIVFDPREFTRLCGHNVNIVGATYPYKDDSGNFPCEFKRISYADEETGLVPADGMPTGFLKIKREVFTRIEPLVPFYYAKGEPGRKVREYFARGIEDGVRIGGDIRFCHLAEKVEETVWCDPHIYLGHTGAKTFEGSFYWKQAVLAKGYYPSLSEAFKTDRWHNKQVLNELKLHWDNGLFQGSMQYIQACCLFAEKFCKEKPCLEMGSGLSTIFLALQAREKGFQLTSLEEDRMWMGKVWGACKDADALSNTEVKHVPTVENEYNVPKDFYDVEYGLVCVDGPCGIDNKNGRRQALKFKADAYIFDDANRPQILKVISELEEQGYNSTVVDATDGRIVMAVAKCT